MDNMPCRVNFLHFFLSSLLSRSLLQDSNFPGIEEELTQKLHQSKKQPITTCDNPFLQDWDYADFGLDLRNEGSNVPHSIVSGGPAR
jgi:hypothetical protein